MTLRFTELDVSHAITYSQAVDAVEASFELFARGEIVMPQRSTSRHGPNGRFFRVMAAVIPSWGVAGVKAGAVHPDRRTSSVHYMLFDIHRPELIAVFEADFLGQLRTAAASAVATRRLARVDASRLALFGTGKHAWSQLLAVNEVRRLQEVRVFSPTPENREAFVTRAKAALPETEVSAVGSPESAAANADIVVSATRSRDPVLNWSQLMLGSHVNAVGSNNPEARELDTETLRKGRLFVDSISQSLVESGEIVQAIREGCSADTFIAGELGDVVIGSIPGRITDDEVTIFKSNGLAFQDLAIAREVYVQATKGQSAGQDGQLVEAPDETS